MNRIRLNLRLLFVALSFGAGLLPGSAGAAPPAGVPRIGVLMPAHAPQEESFRNGLRELGYVEGKTLLIDWRQSEGVTEITQARVLVAELLRSQVDLIVAAGTPACLAAMRATDRVPVIFAPAGDPVASGLAESLARPGKNGTGVSVVSTELYSKRIELLHTLVPRAKRIGYLTNFSNPLAARLFGETQAAAHALGLRLEPVDARNSQELDAALKAIQTSKPDAVVVGGDLVFAISSEKIARHLRKARLPAIFPYPEFHRYGVLMSYGASQKEVGHRVAGYVDKVLKGAKPSELPIEQISKYHLVIDLRVAKELALPVPQELLLRADEVIR